MQEAVQEQSLLPSSSSSSSSKPQEWIRGVNLGGWLVLERYISPYMFAVTDCHLRGDYCWYPGQESANTSAANYQRCDDSLSCQPHLQVPSTAGGDDDEELDYPIDEYSLAEAFLNASQTDHNNTYRNPQGVQNAETWLNSHFDNFIQESDIQQLKRAGLTHLRVPLPHWILGHVQEHEPWMVGTRWQAFLRLCHWARKYNLQVWPDIHTAPGSQNGFDNSGQSLQHVSCQGWSNEPSHVDRSLQILQDITQAIVDAGFANVVTGFGLLNEPFKDCNRQVYFQFMDEGKQIVRDTLGPNTHIYVSDMFMADTFNDGHWWLQNSELTYLDSHYYHVFAEYPRELSPRQHIAFTCQNTWRDTTSCCYEDAHEPWWSKWWRSHTSSRRPFVNSKPSQGVQRMVGEWSAAYDTMPALKLQQLMQGILHNGTLPELDKTLTDAKVDFLKHFVQAQMVTYEALETGVSSGWFFWTAKMEGGAFAEWDFLRGVQEGWIPRLADVDQPSEEVYGTCYDILFDTSDDMDGVVHPLPDPDDLPEGTWMGPELDDDVLLTHGQSLLEPDGIHHRQRFNDHHGQQPTRHHPGWLFWMLGWVSLALMVSVVRRYHKRHWKQAQYTELAQHHVHNV